MRISGTEPSSVILSQTMKFKKLKSDDPQKELARIHGKSAHLAKCFQLSKKSF